MMYIIESHTENSWKGRSKSRITCFPNGLPRTRAVLNRFYCSSQLPFDIEKSDCLIQVGDAKTHSMLTGLLPRKKWLCQERLPWSMGPLYVVVFTTNCAFDGETSDCLMQAGDVKTHSMLTRPFSRTALSTWLRHERLFNGFSLCSIRSSQLCT